MTPPERPTAQQLADHMLVEIARDHRDGRFDRRDEGRATVRSFADLHDHVDANEYAIYAMALYEWPLDVNDEAQMDVLNAATDLVSEALSSTSGPAGIG